MLQLDDSLLERGIPGPFGEPRYLRQLAGLFCAAETPEGVQVLVDAWPDEDGNHACYVAAPRVGLRRLPGCHNRALDLLCEARADRFLDGEAQGPAAARLQGLRATNIVGHLRGTSRLRSAPGGGPARGEHVVERFIELAMAARNGHDLPWCAELTGPGVPPLYQRVSEHLSRLARADRVGEPLDEELAWLRSGPLDLRLCAARRLLRRESTPAPLRSEARGVLLDLVDEGAAFDVLAVLEQLPVAESGAPLVGLLRHRNPEVSLEALLILREASGADHGPDPALWAAELDLPACERSCGCGAATLLARALLHAGLVELACGATPEQLASRLEGALGDARSVETLREGVVASLSTAPEVDDLFGTDDEIEEVLERALRSLSD